MNPLTIEDEIKLLDAGRQRMQVHLEMTERRIEALKRKI
jgi:anti-sigma28 factor (negative regulator of flagellin synthesis)